MAKGDAEVERGASYSRWLVLLLFQRDNLMRLTCYTGCALTVWALVGASRSIRAGTQAKTNQMFRFRIYAQGFTLAVMGVGSYYYQADRKKRKVFEAKIAEQKAEERKQAWIRELEARDREDQAMMENKEAAKRTAKARAAKARAAGLESPALQGNELPQEKGSRGPGVLDAVKNLTEDS